MNMNGMYKEDADNKKNLNAVVERDRLKDEADIVLQGNADQANQNYEIVKPEGGYEGVEVAANPFQFAQQHDDKKVLVIHGDGSFDRYNFDMPEPAATE